LDSIKEKYKNKQHKSQQKNVELKKELKEVKEVVVKLEEHLNLLVNDISFQ
jgi:hypothetical protein